MQQNNPQPIRASEHEEDSSKLLDDSFTKRGNSGPVVEIQIKHNNHQTMIAFEMSPETQPQLSKIVLSSSRTPNNSARNIDPSPQSSISTRLPVEDQKLSNLLWLFYFGPWPLCRVNHVGICKAEENSLWELNMDTDLVRSTLVSLDFPSNFDKEMLDSVGNWGHVKFSFCHVGPCNGIVSETHGFYHRQQWNTIVGEWSWRTTAGEATSFRYTGYETCGNQEFGVGLWVAEDNAGASSRKPKGHRHWI